MPHSALTRWLKQGLARDMCPLCRAAHKLDREYMWHFFDERSSDEDALDQVAAARGFCSHHAEQLRRIEVDGLKSTIAISDVYEHTLRTLAAELAALDDSHRLAAATCPACANRDHGVAQNARYLLDELSENAGFRERFRASPGLCVAHFQLAWDASRTSEERALLRTPSSTPCDHCSLTFASTCESNAPNTATSSREPRPTPGSARCS